MVEPNISKRLREVRLEHNLKQEDLAKVLGIDRSAYSGYEIGRTKIPVKNLYRLADIYNMSLDKLIGRNVDTQPSRVKTGGVSSGVDPIATLKQDEQLLLMYYRIADEERKKEILKSLEDYANNADKPETENG